MAVEGYFRSLGTESPGHGNPLANLTVGPLPFRQGAHYRDSPVRLAGICIMQYHLNVTTPVYCFKPPITANIHIYICVLFKLGESRTRHVLNYSLTEGICCFKAARVFLTSPKLAVSPSSARRIISSTKSCAAFLISRLLVCAVAIISAAFC